MDKNFTSALHKAIDNFGKDIVKEKRFVDIVSDYYPAMAVDHPAWKKVLTAIIVEGFGNDILVCNSNIDARLYVDKYTNTVSKINGFDKKLVEDILMEICSILSISLVSPTPTKPIKPSNPKPKKKPTSKPSPVPPTNNGKGRKKPRTPPTNPSKPNKRHKTWHYIVLLISLLFSLSGMYGSRRSQLASANLRSLFVNGFIRSEKI